MRQAKKAAPTQGSRSPDTATGAVPCRRRQAAREQAIGQRRPQEMQTSPETRAGLSPRVRLWDRMLSNSMAALRFTGACYGNFVRGNQGWVVEDPGVIIQNQAVFHQ